MFVERTDLLKFSGQFDEGVLPVLTAAVDKVSAS